MIQFVGVCTKCKFVAHSIEELFAHKDQHMTNAEENKWNQFLAIANKKVP